MAFVLGESPCFDSWVAVGETQVSEAFSEHPGAQVALAVWLRWLSAESSWQPSCLLRGHSLPCRDALSAWHQMLGGCQPEQGRSCPTSCFGIDFDLSQILMPWQFGTLLSVPNYFSWILLTWKSLLGPLKTPAHLRRQCCPKNSLHRGLLPESWCFCGSSHLIYLIKECTNSPFFFFLLFLLPSLVPYIYIHSFSFGCLWRWI